MIEPQSAQLGASPWTLKATFCAPSESVTVPAPEPSAGLACPFVPAACPLAWPVAMTLVSSRGAATVIDLGSADGHFFLGHLGDGMFAGAVGVNVDANPLYEPSLRAIADTVGGHYVIAAVSDREGELEMTTAIHPYWNSLRPEGDLYWEQMNHLSQGKVRVPAVTVDSLKRRFNLAGPFLIKMDVQGAEAAEIGRAHV